MITFNIRTLEYVTDPAPARTTSKGKNASGWLHALGGYRVVSASDGWTVEQAWRVEIGATVEWRRVAVCLTEQAAEKHVAALQVVAAGKE